MTVPRRIARATALALRLAALLAILGCVAGIVILLSRALTSSVFGVPVPDIGGALVALILMAAALGLALELTRDRPR